MSTSTFPPPNATREEIDAWREQNGLNVEHEAPPMANGPSIVCSACGKVRVNITRGPFCRGCMPAVRAFIDEGKK